VPSVILVGPVQFVGGAVAHRARGVSTGARAGACTHKRPGNVGFRGNSGRGLGIAECPLMTVGSIGQCNTARSLSAGVSKPKVFRGR
jgi:hypothetical protein